MELGLFDRAPGFRSEVGGRCSRSMVLRLALVQICAKGATRPAEWQRLRGESCIPECRDSLVFETETSQGELPFANTVEQFDAGDGRSCAIKVLEAEHRSGPGFDTTVIRFDQIVQVFRRSQLGVLPCLVFLCHLAHCSVRCGLAIQGDANWCPPLGSKRLAERRLGRCDVSCRT